MYADYNDIKARCNTDVSEEKVWDLLEEAAAIIDAYNRKASCENKKIVSIRMVTRAIGADVDVPIGATQGTVSALGYSQTWTMGTGASTGELYLSKMDKKLLGVGNKVGFVSPWGDAT